MNQIHGNIEVRENDVRCIACGKTLEFNWDQQDKVIVALSKAFAKQHEHPEKIT